MTLQTYALIDVQGNVDNLIAFSSTPTPPTGYQYVPIGNQPVSVGWTYANGVFTNPSPPVLTAAQVAVAAATAAIAKGLTISSTSTPTLNGTYSLTPNSQSNINAVVTYIILNNTFPGGQSAMPWVDQNGSAHVFTSLSVFKAFSTAIADYVAAVSLYADSGGTQGSLPNSNVTII